MPDSDIIIWRQVERAAGHFILAHMGRHSAHARANLYARAAGIFMTVGGLLMERAEAMEEQNPAEAMIERAWR